MSVTQSSVVPQAVIEAAERLSPHRVIAVEELRKGANNRIFRVLTPEGDFALKKYPQTDPRDRQGAEARALEFFARIGVKSTPELVATDPMAKISLLSWVHGMPVNPIMRGDVEQFATFQISLDAALDDRVRSEIGEASEACLSGHRIISHITSRLQRLEAVRDEVQGFASFFEDSLRPALPRFEQEARKTYEELDLNFDNDIPLGRRTLIASDFGAHNALRRPDGRLAFVDFEYFGWDDRLTSIGNFVLHPGMRLTEEQEALYVERLMGCYGPSESRRLSALMPLFQLRWCTIILGELLPDRWHHRLEANAVFADRESVQRTQIEKARRLLDLACRR